MSHDRQFINNTATTIVEVTGGGLVGYTGNYDSYLEEKSLRNELQKNAFENQQQKIRQTERFVERFRAKATKAKQVQSRVKALGRMDVIEDVIDEAAKVNFKFNFGQKSGRHVCIIDNVSKSYPDISILKNASATIGRGDKIALICANGKGKSTLLRIINGSERTNGKISNGHNVIPSFYAQHQLEALNIQNEILDELKQFGSNKSDQELRSVLGCFLFSDEEVFKKIKVLSGGEKSRVALAKTLISEANFLLLDEPTNHLDIQSVNILTQALNQYEGTFIVVSHDRQFVTDIANKIWYIENQEIKEYPGTYEEFVWWKANQYSNGSSKKSEVQEKSKPDKEKVVKQKSNPNQNELNKLKKELEKIESLIESEENKKNKLENELANPEIFSDPVKLEELNTVYKNVMSSLEEQSHLWEVVGLQIEQLEE